MWKRIWVICLLLAMLGGCTSKKEPVTEIKTEHEEEGPVISVSDWKPGDPYEQLSVSEGYLRDETGDVLQLRGVSSHGIAWYPQYIQADAFADIRNAGGNLVRLASYTEGWSCYLEEPEKNLDLIRAGIDAAKENGLYVIIDWHILEDGNPLTHAEEAETFFRTLTSEYPDDPAILYEICNEPNNVSWEDICSYADRMFAVIRENSPHAVILLGVPGYSYEIQRVLQQPYEGENFAYTYHFYAGEHGGYASFRGACKMQVPVFVSEWGVGFDKESGIALDKGEEFVSYLNENHISWCAWALSNKDEVYAILKPECEAVGGFTDEDLTDYGKLIFDNLKGVR